VKAVEGTKEYEKILKFVSMATVNMKVSPRKVVREALDDFDEGLILSGELTLDQAALAVGLWYKGKPKGNGGEL
jgi:hypothetical protein